MPREVTVHVIDYGRRNLVMRYVDPDTGRQIARTAGTPSLKDARKKAAQWEAEINEGRYKPSPLISWDQFRDDYDKQHLAALAASSRPIINGVLDSFQTHQRPVRVSHVTTARLSSYQAQLRSAGRAETTIQVHTSHLRAALRWAHDMGYIAAVPKIPKVPRSKAGAKLMKGRPLTLREVVKLLRAVPVVVGSERAPAWRRYVKGLYFSGLRLEESIMLSWDDPAFLMVDLSGRRPMLRVNAEQEKGFQDRILPMAPEFAEFLLRTPLAERSGPVFTFPRKRDWGRAVRKDGVSKVLSDVGRASGVVVDGRSGKFASAHDLRRSFGERWSRRVMPQVLMELMRHDSIETTLRYYVGVNADATAAVLWTAHDARNVQARSGNSAGIACPHCGKKIDARHLTKAT